MKLKDKNPDAKNKEEPKLEANAETKTDTKEEPKAKDETKLEANAKSNVGSK